MGAIDVERYADEHPNYFVDEIEPHLAEWLPRVAFTTLLDAGCGDGSLLAALHRRGHLKGRRAIGVDLSQTRVEIARRHVPGLEARVDDVETLGTVEGAGVDFVISTQVLEHVDDARMLRAIGRVLAPGKLAYVSTVAKRPWARFIWRTPEGRWALDPTHVREYERDDELLDLLDAAGLELVDQRKTPVAYPVVDFVVRRLGVQQRGVFARPRLRALRGLRVPIPGYWIWSLVLRRRGDP